MPPVSADWELEVTRGPGWLFVSVKPISTHEPFENLADVIWELVQQHLVSRVTVELDHVPLLDSHLLGQLLLLNLRIKKHNGLLRICGLSPFNQRILSLHGLDGHLAAYPTRRDAVMGNECRKPR